MISTVRLSSQMFFTDTIKISNLILILQCIRFVIKGGFFLLQTKEVKIEWRGEDRQQYSTSHKSSIYIFFLRRDIRNNGTRY